SYAYYENLNFFLKEEIAQFEDSLYDEKIEKVVDFFENNNDINFNEWLNKIDVELLPKKLIAIWILSKRAELFF
ncbi:hypothetical protein MQX88_005143, partial [Escherichia coli]|nr:hypothetical protein [Escherichia coli]